MNCVAMKICIAGLFSLNIWSIFTAASTPSATFDLCGIKEIRENVTLSLNFSAENAMKTGGECSRVILLKSRRVKLTVEELNVASGAVFEIQDGPGLNKGEKIGPKDGSQLPSSYVSSGNAMFIRFKGGNGPSIFRGKISSEPYQDTCHCRGVMKGKLECFETERLRKCEVKCDPSYMELSLNKEVTCDLKNGTWDVDIHSRPLVCQKVENPIKIKATVNFNYANLTCKQVDLQKVTNIFREFIGNNSDVRSKGVCFSASDTGNRDCNERRLQVNCSTNGILAETTITITDRIVEPSNLTDANSKLQELYTAYNNLKLRDVLDSADLVIKKENESFTIAKESIAIITTPWCDGENDYIKVPGNATYFVCSTCPLHHLYNVTTHTCEKCPSGSFAQTRARSCTQKNGTVMITPIKVSCNNTCMKGKRVDANSWMCEWCPRNTYQNSSTKINPECVPCPGDKQTVFPGAQDVSECHDPCLSAGTFLNASSGACQDCPVGTYMDVDKHAFIRCKMCEMGKTTRGAGSKASSDCYKCIPGQFFNSTAMMCTACPRGKYQDEMNQDSCKDCTSGTSTLEFGSNNSSECVKVCGLGKFFNDSNGMCFDCPKNTYQNLEQHRAKECKSCGSNKITNATGQSDISRCFVSCEKGWFLEKSVFQCKKCPKGQYQDQSGQDQCKQCPDGKSTINEGHSNESSCITTCMKGQFYETSNTTCSPCPYGTYQNTENHQIVTCQLCPSKKTSVKEGADDSKQCRAIDEKSRYQAVMSLKFTSLSWSEELKDENSVEYHETKTKIEDAIKFEFRKDPSFDDVKVTALTKGSVVADFELYFNDKMSSDVPGEALQVATQSGKVGNFSVSPESLKILQQDCAQPLGMENRKIKNEQISASTYLVKNFEPYEGRLNLKGGRGWYAKYNRRDEYLQIDFKRKVNITAVATQGGHPQKLLYVKEYKLNMSDDGEIWNEYTENGKRKVFNGNNDPDTVVRNNLAHTVTSRFIRFLPQSWNEDIFMRVEVYGCLANALLPTAAATTPDVAAVKADDDTWSWGAYLGIVFAVLLIVGTVVAIICWKKKSREKKHAAETDQALMGISKYGDGEYRVIEKNAAEPDDEDDENVV